MLARVIAKIGMVATIVTMSVMAQEQPAPVYFTNPSGSRSVEAYERIVGPVPEIALSPVDYGYMIFAEIPDAQERASIEQRTGVKFVRLFRTDSTRVIYKVRFFGSIGSARRICAAGASFFFNLEPIVAADKLTPRLYSKKPFLSGETFSGGVYAQVTFYSTVSKEVADSIVNKYADVVLSADPQTYLIKLPTGNIDALAAQQCVESIRETNMFPRPLMATARDISKVNQIQDLDTVSMNIPFSTIWDSDSFTGKGVTVGIYDYPVDTTILDLRERLTDGRTAFRNAPDGVLWNLLDTSFHGTLVAAVACGNGWQSKTGGAMNFQWRGVAPKSRIFSASPGNVVGLKGDVNNHSVAVSNYPWYAEIDRDIDNYLSAHNRISPSSNIAVHSAGNFGGMFLGGTPQNPPQTGYYSLASNSKNAIVVGVATKVTGARAQYSSMGPTRDGRIKPDIMAPGSWYNVPQSSKNSSFYVDFDTLAIYNGDNSPKTGKLAWGFSSETDMPFAITDFSAWAIDQVVRTSDGYLRFTPQKNCSVLEGRGYLELQSNQYSPTIATDKFFLRYRIKLPTGQLPIKRFYCQIQAYVDGRWRISKKAIYLDASDGEFHELRFATGDYFDDFGNHVMCGKIRFYFVGDADAAGICTIASSNTTIDPYDYQSGSSFAAAHVSGIIALMLQKYSDNFLAPSENIHDNAFWNSTARAILIHTATDLIKKTCVPGDYPNPDYMYVNDMSCVQYNEGPDYATGWGLVNAQKAVQFTDTALFTQRSLDNGESHFYKLTVTPEDTVIRVTLAWDDPGFESGNFSGDARKSHLVNDLDLSLVNPTGDEIFLPWVLNPLPQKSTIPADGIDSLRPNDIGPAVRSYDRINNVEVVDIKKPDAGEWTVIVRGQRVPMGPADYSLVGDKHLTRATAGTASNGKVIKWIYQVNAPAGGSTMPALSKDNKTVYFGLRDSMLYAINTVDGTLKWKLKLNRAIWGSPAVDDPIVFVGTGNYDWPDSGNIYSILDAGTFGTIGWYYPTLLGFTATPSLNYNSKIVYIGSLNDTMYALNYDASFKWRKATMKYCSKLFPWECTKEISNTAVLADNKAFVHSSAGRLWAFDAYTGSQLWSRKFPNVAASTTPTFNNNKIYSGSMAFRRSISRTKITGDSLPDIPLSGDSPREPGPTITGQKIITQVSSPYNDSVIIYNDLTGKRDWAFSYPSMDMYASPTLGNDGKLYISTNQGMLLMVDTTLIQPTRFIPLPREAKASIIGSDSILYVICGGASGSSYLVALKTTSAGMGHSWPCGHGDAQNSSFVPSGRHQDLVTTSVGTAKNQSSIWTGNSLSICGSAAGPGATRDGIVFSSDMVSGNFGISGRMTSITPQTEGSVSGLMFRATNEENAPAIALFATSFGEIRVANRIAFGGALQVQSLGLSQISKPWLKMERFYGEVHCFSSIDGISWRRIAKITTGTGSGVAGPFYASGSKDVEGCATFDSLSFKYFEDMDKWTQHRTLYLNTSNAGACVFGLVTDLPVLVHLGKTAFDFASAQSNGGDLRFTRADGYPLPFAIDRYDSLAGAATIWVLADSVYGNTADQRIIMHWGREDVSSIAASSQVFSRTNGFRGVWHLDEAGTGASGEYRDATGSGLDATCGSRGNLSPEQTRGIIESAQTFSLRRGWQTIEINGGPALSVGRKDTAEISFWARFNGRFALMKKVTCKGKDINEDLDLCTFDNKKKTDKKNCVAEFNDSYAWYHFTVLRDGTTQRLFINGTLIFSAKIRGESPVVFWPLQLTSNGKLEIGRLFSGSIDEVRVSIGVLRTPDWVKINFQNQQKNQTLIEVD